MAGRGSARCPSFGRALYGEASAAIAEWVEWYEDDPGDYAEQAAEDGSPAVPAVLGPRLFYRVADLVIGPHTRGPHGYVYAVSAQ